MYLIGGEREGNPSTHENRRSKDLERQNEFNAEQLHYPLPAIVNVQVVCITCAIPEQFGPRQEGAFIPKLAQLHGDTVSACPLNDTFMSASDTSALQSLTQVLRGIKSSLSAGETQQRGHVKVRCGVSGT